MLSIDWVTQSIGGPETELIFCEMPCFVRDFLWKETGELADQDGQ